MTFAIRNDGLGWRAVNGPDDVGPDEHYSADQPAPIAQDPKDAIRTQIRALESQYADAQAKVTRQALLALALERAIADPLAQGMTPQEVHSNLMTRDNGYKALYTLEQSIEELRGQV
jgi:hypothetical protein